MANLPVNIGYGTVEGRFLIALADGTDADLNPDGVAASGSIFFIPSLTVLKGVTAHPEPVTILPATVECGLDDEGYLVGPDGNRGVRLVATDDLDANPTGWTWKVQYRLTDSDGSALGPIITQEISVPEGQTINLTGV